MCCMLDFMYTLRNSKNYLFLILEDYNKSKYSTVNKKIMVILSKSSNIQTGIMLSSLYKQSLDIIR